MFVNWIVIVVMRQIQATVKSCRGNHAGRTLNSGFENSGSIGNLSMNACFAGMGVRLNSFSM